MDDDTLTILIIILAADLFVTILVLIAIALFVRPLRPPEESDEKSNLTT